MGRFLRASLGLSIVVLLVGVFAFASVAPAFAAAPNRIDLGFFRTHSVGVNGAQLKSAYETQPALGGSWTAAGTTFFFNVVGFPDSGYWGSSPGPSSTGARGWKYLGNGGLPAGTLPAGRYIGPLQYGGEPWDQNTSHGNPIILPWGWSWFNHSNYIPPTTDSKRITYQFRWIKNSVQEGLTTYDWQTWTLILASKRAAIGLFNPSVMYDDGGGTVPNTTNLTVRNIQFAQSASRIGGEELTLDNPEVTNIFHSSPDTNRVGPIVATPGQEVTLTPASASILEPEVGGRTVLMKGEILDTDGSWVPFLAQSAAVDDGPVTTPASSWWSLSVLVVLALGVILLNRKMLPGLS